jgi:hypothetical protein
MTTRCRGLSRHQTCYGIRPGGDSSPTLSPLSGVYRAYGGFVFHGASGPIDKTYQGAATLPLRLPGVFCPTPQKGIFQSLRSVIRPCGLDGGQEFQTHFSSAAWSSGQALAPAPTPVSPAERKNKADRKNKRPFHPYPSAARRRQLPSRAALASSPASSACLPPRRAARHGAA